MFRISGALIATVASVAWIVERLLNVQTVIASLVESTAQHGPLIAVALFLASVFCRLIQSSRMPGTQDMDRTSPEMR
jgi:hypothetical protein